LKKLILLTFLCFSLQINANEKINFSDPKTVVYYINKTMNFPVPVDEYTELKSVSLVKEETLMYSLNVINNELINNFNDKIKGPVYVNAFRNSTCNNIDYHKILREIDSDSILVEFIAGTKKIQYRIFKSLLSQDDVSKCSVDIIN